MSNHKSWLMGGYSKRRPTLCHWREYSLDLCALKEGYTSSETIRKNGMIWGREGGYGGTYSRVVCGRINRG